MRASARFHRFHGDGSSAQTRVVLLARQLSAGCVLRVQEEAMLAEINADARRGHHDGPQKGDGPMSVS